MGAEVVSGAEVPVGAGSAAQGRSARALAITRARIRHPTRTSVKQLPRGLFFTN